jgi:hypothetical protein
MRDTSPLQGDECLYVKISYRLSGKFWMVKKKRNWYPPRMEVKSCRVTISDMEGIAHTVEVTAATLYEAVALGLKQLQGNEWVEGIARGLNSVRVSVKNVQIEHTVTIGEFTKWLERRTGSPAEMTRRKKVREILDLQEPS